VRDKKEERNRRRLEKGGEGRKEGKVYWRRRKKRGKKGVREGKK
jgi:hypothetical protein